MKAGDLVRAAQNVDRKLIAGVTVFDVYEGKGIEPDKKSIAIAVTLQPREKTMTDEEIDAVAAKIVAEVSKRTGGVLAVSPTLQAERSCEPGIRRLGRRSRLWPSFAVRVRSRRRNERSV